MIRKTVAQMVAAEGAASEAALKRLNVCRGGFTYQAAQAILSLQDDENTLDARLTELQAWQFVTLRGKRYEIDPLVIAAVQEDASAQRPHYNYYEALARQRDQQQDYYGLDVESANLEAAFEWAIQHDAEAAYWLLNACTDFLSNRGRFTQRLDWIERVVKALDGASEELRANAQNSLGAALQEYPFGERRDNLRRAVEAYQAALKYRTPERAPLDYAMTQNNLGNAYGDLAALEDREANLKRAVAAFQAALHYRTPQSAPLAYAMTQNNLGAAYRDLAALEDRAGNLKRAVAAYQDALQYRTPQAAPLDYAMTQNNLGNAYRNLAALEDREANLKRAVAAFQAALQYRTPQAAPLAYATTQNNLGAAYRNLAALEDREANLKRAVEAYQQALVYRTPQSAPLDYAQTQWNLRLAYRDLGNLPAAIACAREAEKYYRLMGYVADADTMLRWIAELEQKLNNSGA